MAAGEVPVGSEDTMPSDDLETETVETALVATDVSQEPDPSAGEAKTEDTPPSAGEPASVHEAAAQALARERGEALQPKKEEAEEPPADPAQPEAKPEAKKDGQPGSKDPDFLTDDDLKLLRPEARKKVERRIANLTRERKETSEKLETEMKRVADYQQRAEAFDKFQSVMSENDISGEDLANTMRATAAFKRGDFQTFISIAEPLLAEARMALGLEVAPDLRKLVDDGEMTEEVGRQQTRERLEAARLKQERDRLAQGQETQRKQQDQERAHTAIRTAADAEVAKIKQEDPQFDLKQPLIIEAVKAHIERFGPVTTEAAARALARSAHEAATLRLAAQRKAKTAAPPTPSGSPALNRAPASALEAARIGLARAQGRV